MSTLPNHYPWNRSGKKAPQVNRPYAEVVIHYNGKRNEFGVSSTAALTNFRSIPPLEAPSAYR